MTSCELRFQLTAFKNVTLQFHKSQGYGKTGYKNVLLQNELTSNYCAFYHPPISKPGLQQIRLLQKVQSSRFYFLKQNLYVRFPDRKANLFRDVTPVLGVTPALFCPIGSPYPQYTTYRNLICNQTGLNRE